jgi:hypothetical protein
LILTILTRALERLLVVLAGGLAIYLGYRLFIDMPSAERGSGKVNLPGGISIFLSRVGPGVFFSLFGAVVIGLSFQYGISFSDSQPRAAMAVAEAEPSEIARNWSGISSNPTALAPVEAISTQERDRVVAVVAALNRMEQALPADLKPTERVNLKYALRDARVRLLVSVWDAAAWGEAAAFQDWVKANEPNPPPQDVAVAAELYLQGRANAVP